MGTYEHYEPVFSVLLSCVESIGGDGNGLLIVKQELFRKIAIWFNEYLRAVGRHYKVQTVESTYCLWSDGSNENIIIAGTDFDRTTFPYVDIVIETW